MKRNIGPMDRTIRFVIAMALFLLGFWTSGWILFGVGLFVLFEAVFSWCIVYHILGKNSCPRK